MIMLSTAYNMENGQRFEIKKIESKPNLIHSAKKNDKEKMVKSKRIVKVIFLFIFLPENVKELRIQKIIKLPKKGKKVGT